MLRYAKWLFLSLLVTVPTLAHAGLGSFFQAIGTAFLIFAAFYTGGAVLLGYTAAQVGMAFAIAGTVFGTVEARSKARKQRAEAKAKYNSSLSDRLSTTLTADPPWRITYGRALTGGSLVAAFTTDKNGVKENGESYKKPDAYKHLVVVLASHEVQEIHEVFINGFAVGKLNASGGATSPEFVKSINPKKRVKIRFGTPLVLTVPVLRIISAEYSTGSSSGGDDYVPADVTLSADRLTITVNNPQGATVEYREDFTESLVTIKKHLGTDDQTVDTYLSGLVPSQWTSSDRLAGLAYGVITLDLEDSRFQSGVPEISFDISGRKVLDPRTGLTAWSDNPALCIRDFLTSVWGYGVEPSDVDNEFCISAANACDVPINLTVGTVLRTNQKKYTLNGSFTTEDSREAVLNDMSEAMAGYTVYGAKWQLIAGAWTEPVMSLTDDDLDGQIDILQAGAGLEELFNGVRGNYLPVTTPIGVTSGYSVVGDYTAGATVITLADGSGPIYAGNTVAFTDFIESDSDTTRYSIIAGTSGPGQITIAAPGLLKLLKANDNRYQNASLRELGLATKTPVVIGSTVKAVADMEPYQNLTFQAADGLELWTDVTLPYTNDKARCKNLVRIFTERSRASQIISYPAKLKAWPLQLGDRVTVSSTEYGFSNKIYRVTDWQFSLTSAVNLTLQEDDISVYDLADAAVEDPTVNSILKNPWFVSKLSGLTAQSGTEHLIKTLDGTILPRVKVSWDPIADPLIVDGSGYVEVSWQSSSNSDEALPLNYVNQFGESNSAYILGATEGSFVVIGVRAVNGIGVKGAIDYLVHKVIGKSEPPGNVSSFSESISGSDVVFTWDKNLEADYGSTVLRVGVSWDTSTLLFNGSTSTYTWLAPSSGGTYKVWAKHFDSSGNESLIAASRTFTTLPYVPPVDGVDGISFVLSNDSHTLPATSAGVVLSFEGAVSTGSISTPTDDITDEYIYTKVDYNVTSTISGSTVTVTAWGASGASQPLLLHADDVVGTTSPVDSSSFARLILNADDTPKVVAEDSFSGNAIDFPGQPSQSNLLYTRAYQDFAFGAGDFAVQFQVKPYSLRGFRQFITGVWGDSPLPSQHGWAALIGIDGKVNFDYSLVETGLDYTIEGPAIAVDKMNQVGISREGNVLTIAVHTTTPQPSSLYDTFTKLNNEVNIGNHVSESGHKWKIHPSNSFGNLSSIALLNDGVEKVVSAQPTYLTTDGYNFPIGEDVYVEVECEPIDGDLYIEFMLKETNYGQFYGWELSVYANVNDTFYHVGIEANSDTSTDINYVPDTTLTSIPVTAPITVRLEVTDAINATVYVNGVSFWTGSCVGLPQPGELDITFEGGYSGTSGRLNSIKCGALTSLDAPYPFTQEAASTLIPVEPTQEGYVALSGDGTTMVVVDYANFPIGISDVITYVRTSGDWALESTFQIADVAASRVRPPTLSADGNILVIIEPGPSLSASYWRATGVRGGSVIQTYDRTAGLWTLRNTLAISESERRYLMCGAISADGTKLAVYEINYSPSIEPTSYIYGISTFVATNGVWSQVGQTVGVPSAPPEYSPNHFQTMSMSSDGNWITYASVKFDASAQINEFATHVRQVINGELSANTIVITLDPANTDFPTSYLNSDGTLLFIGYSRADRGVTSVYERVTVDGVNTYMLRKTPALGNGVIVGLTSNAETFIAAGLYYSELFQIRTFNYVNPTNVIALTTQTFPLVGTINSPVFALPQAALSGFLACQSVATVSQLSYFFELGQLIAYDTFGTATPGTPETLATHTPDAGLAWVNAPGANIPFNYASSWVVDGSASIDGAITNGAKVANPTVIPVYPYTVTLDFTFGPKTRIRNFTTPYPVLNTVQLNGADPMSNLNGWRIQLDDGPGNYYVASVNLGDASQSYINLLETTDYAGNYKNQITVIARSAYEASFYLNGRNLASLTTSTPIDPVTAVELFYNVGGGNGFDVPFPSVNVEEYKVAYGAILPSYIYDTFTNAGTSLVYHIGEVGATWTAAQFGTPGQMSQVMRVVDGAMRRPYYYEEAGNSLGTANMQASGFVDWSDFVVEMNVTIYYNNSADESHLDICFGSSGQEIFGFVFSQSVPVRKAYIDADGGDASVTGSAFAAGTYNLEVRRIGNVYTMYINGSLVATSILTTVLSGKFGIKLYDKGGGAVVRINSLRVSPVGVSYPAPAPQALNGAIVCNSVCTAVATNAPAPAPQALRAAIVCNVACSTTVTSGDPFFANVELLLRGDAITVGQTTYLVNSGNQNRPYSSYSLGVTPGATAQSVFSSGTSIQIATDSSSGNPLSGVVSHIISGASGIAVNFTHEVWLYPISIVSGEAVITFISPAQYYFVATNGVLGLRDGNNQVIISTSATLQINTWQHVAFTKAGDVYRIFLNGALVGTATNTLAVARPNNVQTGANCIGFIDEYRYTADVARYTASFTPPTAVFPTA